MPHSMNQPCIPYVFCSDPNYLDITLVAMRSLAISNPVDLTCFLVTTEPMGELHLNQFQALSKAYNFNLTLKISENNFLSSLPVTAHITYATYLKTTLPEMFPEFDRLIYLDSDIIVTKDIGKLKTINLAENLVAAVPEHIPERMRTLEIQNYFNAGVLVFNAKKWRENDTLKKIALFSQEDPARICYADQCALNKVVNGYIQPIDPTYNYLLNARAPIPRNLFDDIKIFHFNGRLKPWHEKSPRFHRRLWNYYGIDRAEPITKDLMFPWPRISANGLAGYLLRTFN